MEKKKKRITKQSYVEFLNSISPPAGHDDWIIGGKVSFYLMHRQQYGKAIREYDPIRFEIGFNEFMKSSNGIINT